MSKTFTSSLSDEYYYSLVGDSFLAIALIYDRKLSDSTLLVEMRSNRAFCALSSFYQITCSFMIDWLKSIDALLGALSRGKSNSTATIALNNKFPIMPSLLVTEYVVHSEHKGSASPIFEFISERSPSIMAIVKFYAEINELVQRSVINNIEPSLSLLDAQSKLSRLMSSDDTQQFLSQHALLEKGHIGRKVLNSFYPNISMDTITSDNGFEAKQQRFFYHAKLLAFFDLDYIKNPYGLSFSEMIAQTLKNDTITQSSDFGTQHKESPRHYMVSNIDDASFLKYNIYNLYRLLIHTHEHDFKRSIGSKLIEQYITPEYSDVKLEMFVADIRLANGAEEDHDLYVRFYLLLKLRTTLVNERKKNIVKVKSIMDNDELSIGVRLVELELWFSEVIHEHYLGRVDISQFAAGGSGFNEKLEQILKAEFTELFMQAYSLENTGGDDA